MPEAILVKDDLRHLIPFISEQETRYVLNHVCIKDGHAYATTGQRVGRMKSDKLNYNEPLANGTYKILRYGVQYWLLNQPDIGDFPDCEKVLHVENPTFEFNFYTSHRKSDLMHLSKLIFLLAEKKVMMSMEQAKHLPLSREFKVEGTEPLKPVSFTHEDFKATLMPMRA